MYICIYRLATEITVDSRTLSKVLQICQKNSNNLVNIAKKQEKLEAMINEQNDKINEILSKLQEQDNTAFQSKRGKDKGKRSRSEFYQVNICFSIFLL
jgi:peptidoglycan hydrolase CwlO-like protein